jgi:hypothetical protein
MTTDPIPGVVLGLRAALAGRFRLPRFSGLLPTPVLVIDPARALRGGGLCVFRR